MRITIDTNWHDYGYLATLEGYDGAPDATGPYAMVGRSQVDAKEAAIDLLDNLPDEFFKEKRRMTLGELANYSTPEPRTCPECGNEFCVCGPEHIPCDCHECSPVIGLDGRAI